MELLAELERRLDRVRAARPELTGAIELQGALVRARIEMLEPELPPLRVPPGRALEQLRNGTPLLHQTPAFVDISWSAGLFGRLLEVVLDHQPEAQAALEALESTLDDGLLDVESLFQEAFVQHRQHVAQIASDADVDEELLASLAWLAVAPQLTVYGRPLARYLEAGWDRGYCPVCGVWPGLRELRGVQRVAWSRCLSCGTAWPATPDACTYCGAAPVLHLGLDDDARFGVDACEQCHGYLKTARAFEPSPTELLPLDDLASVHLDELAQRQGYTRPLGVGFPIELGEDAFPIELG